MDNLRTWRTFRRDVLLQPGVSMRTMPVGLAFPR